MMLCAMRDMNMIPNDPNFRQDAESVVSIVQFCQLKIDGTVEKSVADAMKRLWAHKKVQEVFLRGNEYHLPDCAK